MRDSRSQHQNRAQAWIVLRAKMHAHRKAIQDEENRAKRKTQLPGMDRADKIRTWNFPQVCERPFIPSKSLLTNGMLLRTE